MEKRSMIDIFKSRETPNRDEKVLDRINIYITNNLPSLTDGLLDNIPKISEQARKYVEDPYMIDTNDYKEIQKTAGYKSLNSYRLYSTLRVGLVISYLNTGNKLYLLYLSIMMYSSYMVKYFRNGGFNRDVMKYTIDNADNRTDFKKYSSLIIVLNKKIETVESLYKKKLSHPDDDLIVSLILGISTRINDMIKNIASKYYKNFNDPQVKIMMQYTTNIDGKNIISAAGVLSTIREKSVNNLMYINDKLLRMLGYTPNNRRNERYRNAFIKYIPKYFGLMSQLTSAYLDEWMRRNQDKLTLERFKTTFVQQMGNGRGMTEVFKIVDELTDKIVSDTKTELKMTLNVIEVRKSIMKYVIGNIYLTTQELIK